MNHYNFNKLTQEQKWNERNNKWVYLNPEEYIRLLIVSDDLELLKNFEKEPINFDFSYRLKDEILLTLAMQKHAYKTIDYFLNKGLTIKERDIETFVQNHREQENESSFIKVLDKINFSNFNVNNILKSLEDYYYEDRIVDFVSYIIGLKIEIEPEIINKFKEYESLALLLKKIETETLVNEMNDKYAPKNTKEKLHKI